MAASVAIPSFGCLVKKETASGTFTTIIEVVDFDMGMTRGSIEVTHMESPSNTREYIGGLRDMGEVTVNFHFVPTNAQHQLIYEDMTRGADYTDNVDSWQIVFPDTGATTWVGTTGMKGFVTAFSVDGNAVDTPLMGHFTVKLSAAATLP